MSFTSPCPCTPEVRAAACDMLNRLAAFTIALNAAAFKAHHNVEGSWFEQDHALFKATYEAADEWHDMLSERISKLGGVAIDTVEEVGPLAEMAPFPVNLTDGKSLAAELHARCCELNRRVYQASAAAEQAGLVADVNDLGALASDIETMAWRLGKRAA